MIDLSEAERAAIYAALVPGFRTDRKRYPTSYRGGDSQDALAIDIERGWYDHALGAGGDPVALVMRALQCDFRAACVYISRIIGRDILAAPKSRYTGYDLTRAALFRVGLYWRIERALAAAKRKLWGPHHDQAAKAVRTLTQWAERIRPATAVHRPEFDDGAMLTLMRRLARRLVSECIAEAEEAYVALAHVIARREAAS